MCWCLLCSTLFFPTLHCQHPSTAFDCELLSPLLSTALYYAKIDQSYIWWKYYVFALNIFNVFCVLLRLSQYLSASTGPVVACSLYWHLEPHISNLFYHLVSCSCRLQPPITAIAFHIWQLSAFPANAFGLGRLNYQRIYKVVKNEKSTRTAWLCLQTAVVLIGHWEIC